MTSVVDLSLCTLRCHDRGSCFTWPPEPEFSPICACNELWEGKTCEHRQHNPFNRRRDNVANSQWHDTHGVACTFNISDTTCNECGEHRCSADGECEWKAGACTLKLEKTGRVFSFGKMRGHSKGRGASLEANGRSPLTQGRSRPTGERRTRERQLRKLWQHERAQVGMQAEGGRAAAAAAAAVPLAPQHDARRLEAAAALPRVSVCLSGWLGVAVHQGGESLRRHLLAPRVERVACASE